MSDLPDDAHFSILTRLMAFTFAVVLCTPIVLIEAYVLSVLWGWYVVPQFGCAPLRPVFAFGLSVIADFLVDHPMQKSGDVGRNVLMRVGRAAFGLVVGWAGTWFI